MTRETSRYELVPDLRDLSAQQIALELKMRDAGMDRLEKSFGDLEKRGASEESPIAQELLRQSVDKLGLAIGAFINKATSGNAGRAHAQVKLYKDVPPRILAYLTLVGVFHTLGRRPTLAMVTKNIGRRIEDEIRFKGILSVDKKLFKDMGKFSDKGMNYRERRFLAQEFVRNKDDNLVEWEKWTNRECVLIGSKMLDILMDTLGMVELIYIRKSHKHVTQHVQLTEEATEWIRERTCFLATLSPVFEPMIVQPNDWTTPNNGGYLSKAIAPQKIVKTRNANYYSDLFSIHMPDVYKAVNAVQKTAWRVNREVLEVAEACFYSSWDQAGLPASEPHPKPVFATDPESDPEGHALYRYDMAKWYEAEKTRRSKIIAVSAALSSARRYARFDRLYMPHTMDFRGRLYPLPGLNPQGPDVVRGCLQFADGKPIGSDGGYWLAVHLANCAEFDDIHKAPLDDRVAWVYANQDKILQSALAPMDFRWWTDADKPFCFLAACFEWLSYTYAGEDHVTRIPIALDGSCSGIQHFSMALRDEQGGNAVNLVPNQKPQDIYTEVAKAVEERLKEDVGSEELFTVGKGLNKRTLPVSMIAQQWLSFGISRKLCKRPTMTYGYGARAFGFTEQIQDDTLNPALIVHKKKVKNGEPSNWPFGSEKTGIQAVYMAGIMRSQIEKIVVKAAEAMGWLQEFAATASKEGIPLNWTVPDGFPVHQSYMMLDHKKIETTLAGKIRRVTIKNSTDKLDKKSQRAGISPNFVHSLDACHLRMTVCRAVDNGINSFAVIHDSFAVHASDTGTFFKTVREALVDMYTQQDVLEDFSAEISSQLTEKYAKKLPDLPEKGNLDPHAVLQSDFAFA